MSESPAISASASPAPAPMDTNNSRNSKRKAETPDGEATISKRASKRKKSKGANSADDEIDEENQINRAISKMDGRLMADYIARQTKRFEPNLSTVELEDRRIPGKNMKNSVQESVHGFEELYVW